MKNLIVFVISILSESELQQTYGQALVRADASRVGLADYEPRLSPFEGVPDVEEQEGIDLSSEGTNWELSNVIIYDLLGRPTVVLKGNDSVGFFEINESLRNYLPGYYYIHGVDATGVSVTKTYFHAGR